jgi:hypothetical protein
MSSHATRLATIRGAAFSCRTLPGRTGRVLHLPEAEDVLVAGDMHGHLENFRRVMLRADLANNPRRHLVVQELIHGPYRYPAGGDRSHQLVELACALMGQYAGRVHYLPGNHELAQLTGRPIGKQDDDLNEQFLAGVRTAHGEGADEVTAAFMALFQALPLAVRTSGGLFLSHSLPTAGFLPDWRPESLERDPMPEHEYAPGGAAYSLVWGRDIRPETSAAFLEKVGASALVTGHVPCDAGFELAGPRHLILDTQGFPAAYALIPADRPLADGELAACVRMM